MRNNGILYLHVYLTKSGVSPGPRKGGSYSELYTIHKTKRLNFYGKPNDFTASKPLYWSSNYTVELAIFSDGFEMPAQERINEFVDCDPVTGKFYPILYLNDKL